GGGQVTATLTPRQRTVYSIRSPRAALLSGLYRQSIGVHALDLPGGHRRTRGAAAAHCGAIQQPYHGLPAARVVPQDVAAPLIIIVAGLRDRPRPHRRTDQTTADQRCAIDEPGQRLTGRRAVPENVAVAVAVKVACTRDHPAARGT